MLDVAVFGALGRMGSEICRSIKEDPELDLVGAVDPAVSGDADVLEIAGERFEVVDGPAGLDPDSMDVIVDFTTARDAPGNIRWALDHGIHAVVGTTGLSEDEIESIGQLADDTTANVIIAPNFALGAVLMMKFSEMAAGVYDQCEIVELHHRGKLDAPSGTAISTADRIENAIEAGTVPDSEEKKVKGSRGGSVGPIRIHSVRLDGFVASQEVIFGSGGERLAIRHDSIDRSCFMPGIMMAVKAVGRMPGLTIGLEPVLDLD